jgi:hypothetical protein
MQDVLRLGHEPAALGDLWSNRIGIVCESGANVRENAVKFVWRASMEFDLCRHGGCPLSVGGQVNAPGDYY